MSKKLKELLQRLIKEERQKLQEVEITDPDVEAEIQEYASLADELDRMQARIKELEKRFTELDIKFRQMLDNLAEELGEASDTFIRARNILITIKRKGYNRTNYKYKDAFEWLFTRVSPQMKALVEEALETNKSITYIESKLGVQYESRINENWLSDLFNKVKGFFNNLIMKIKNANQKANSSLDKLEKMLK